MNQQMDKKSWKIAQEIYETIGDLSLEEFQSEIEKLPLPKEISDLLIDLKRSEKEASSYFDSLEENVSEILEPKLSEILELLRKIKSR